MLFPALIEDFLLEKTGARHGAMAGRCIFANIYSSKKIPIKRMDELSAITFKREVACVIIRRGVEPMPH